MERLGGHRTNCDPEVPACAALAVEALRPEDRPVSGPGATMTMRQGEMAVAGLSRAERRRRRRWSRGRKALELLLTQADWTHRRAETLSLEAHGETRQRVSWDFTLPEELAIKASKDRIAVPLATMRKVSLKRLDVTDAGGGAVPIWGTDDNGVLATEALVSGLSGVLGRSLRSREHQALRQIVLAAEPQRCQTSLTLIRDTLALAGRTVEGTPLMALAEDLAVNFVLIVELPAETAGTRALVKMQYEGDVNGDGGITNAFSAVHSAWFDGAAWSSTRSWHVEVHAPPGLAIRALTASRWDTDDEDIKPLGVSPVLGHTAHVAGKKTPLGSLSWFELELRPARAGLVNQAVSGALVTELLLLAGVLLDGQLYDAIKDPNRASAVVAVMLAVPALLIALLSRGQEHALVSRLLLLPRVVNLAVALVLLFAAAALVLGLNKGDLTGTLRVLFGVQTVLLAAAGIVWSRSVGGDP